jgi:hypothetical protein
LNEQRVVDGKMTKDAPELETISPNRRSKRKTKPETTEKNGTQFTIEVEHMRVELAQCAH